MKLSGVNCPILKAELQMVDRVPVIVTRAEPGARETSRRLKANGILAISSPMLELIGTEEKLPKLDDVAGLLFTSANGVRFFASLSSRRDIPAWCVGPATYAAAKEGGFEISHNADGDGMTLAAYVDRQASPESGKFLHVANSAAAGDVAEYLTRRDFDVLFAPLYEAVPAASLNEDAIAALQREQPALVAIHSAKGAMAFARVTNGIDFRPHTAVAVSEKAALPLSDLNFAQIVWASQPNEDALLETIISVLATL
ncbi:MAG: uroporphyrinogen-III synthase [Pseudomonadota bacterium]